MERNVDVGAGETSAWFHAPRGAPRALCVLGHGAGGRAADPVLVHLTTSLADAGVAAVRFDHLYRARGRNAPDRMPQLVATFRAVVELARAEPRWDAAPLVLGGKSMSGRVAVELARERADTCGLAFLGYPLVPPRARPGAAAQREERLTTWSERPPLLFLTGTRDAFAPDETLERLVARLGPCAVLHRVAGADHGFSVRKRDGRTDGEVREELATRLLAWLDDVLRECA